MAQVRHKCHVCGAVCTFYRIMCGSCFEVAMNVERFVHYPSGRAFVESALRKAQHKQLSL